MSIYELNSRKDTLDISYISNENIIRSTIFSLLSPLLAIYMAYISFNFYTSDKVLGEEDKAAKNVYINVIC